MGHRALLLTAALLASCGGPVAPAPEPPPRPGAAATAERSGPAATPQSESARIARPVDGVAIAPSRTGRHRFRLDAAIQRVRRSARGEHVSLEAYVVLVPGELDALLAPVSPVRRFVTTDGFERASPEQQWSVQTVQGRISSQGIDLGGRRHRGLRNLDLDARIYEVRERETFTVGPYGEGEHEARLGPFPARIDVDGDALTVTAWNDADGPRAWNAEHEQPLCECLDFLWVLESLDATDGKGRTLVLSGASGSGAVGTARYHTDLASYGAPVPPITVALSVPASYRREDTSLYFAEVPLETVEGE